MKNLHDLRSANLARNSIWDPEGKLDSDFFMLELGGEVGELLNLLKKKKRERLGLRGSRATQEQIAEELADVIIVQDLLGISLKQIVLEPEIHRAHSDLLYEDAPLKLLEAVGDLAASIIDLTSDEPSWRRRVLTWTWAIAGLNDIDLLKEIPKKFNLTSRKYQLPIFINEQE